MLWCAVAVASLRSQPVGRAPPRALRSPPSVCSSIDDDSSYPISSPVTQLVRLQCPRHSDALLLSELLLESGALFVSMSDADAGSEEEVPLFAVHPRNGSDKMVHSNDPEAETGAMDARNIDAAYERMRMRRLWSRSSFEVGFAADADVEAALLMCSASAEIELPRFTIENIGKQDWVKEVQSAWPPILLPGCLTIRFPWHSDEDVAALGQELPPTCITLHPGMAFGTGMYLDS